MNYPQRCCAIWLGHVAEGLKNASAATVGLLSQSGR